MEPGFQVLQISHTHNKDQQLYAVFHRIPPAKTALAKVLHNID